MDEYLNRVICGDCLEVMASMPESSVDAIVTDPPCPPKTALRTIWPIKGFP